MNNVSMFPRCGRAYNQFMESVKIECVRTATPQGGSIVDLGVKADCR
jgi:hypothetical protein